MKKDIKEFGKKILIEYILDKYPKSNIKTIHSICKGIFFYITFNELKNILKENSVGVKHFIFNEENQSYSLDTFFSQKNKKIFKDIDTFRYSYYMNGIGFKLSVAYILYKYPNINVETLFHVIEEFKIKINISKLKQILDETFTNKKWFEFDEDKKTYSLNDKYEKKFKYKFKNTDDIINDTKLKHLLILNLKKYNIEKEEVQLEPNYISSTYENNNLKESGVVSFDKDRIPGRPESNDDLTTLSIDNVVGKNKTPLTFSDQNLDIILNKREEFNIDKPVRKIHEERVCEFFYSFVKEIIKNEHNPFTFYKTFAMLIGTLSYIYGYSARKLLFDFDKDVEEKYNISLRRWVFSNSGFEMPENRKESNAWHLGGILDKILHSNNRLYEKTVYTVYSNISNRNSAVYLPTNTFMNYIERVIDNWLQTKEIDLNKLRIIKDSNQMFFNDNISITNNKTKIKIQKNFKQFNFNSLFREIDFTNEMYKKLDYFIKVSEESGIIFNFDKLETQKKTKYGRPDYDDTEGVVFEEMFGLFDEKDRHYKSLLKYVKNPSTKTIILLAEEFDKNSVIKIREEIPYKKIVFLNRSIYSNSDDKYIIYIKKYDIKDGNK